MEGMGKDSTGEEEGQGARKKRKKNYKEECTQKTLPAHEKLKAQERDQ
jgi:hypothetical protein